jgi:hypothetical protein
MSQARRAAQGVVADLQASSDIAFTSDRPRCRGNTRRRGSSICGMLETLRPVTERKQLTRNVGAARPHAISSSPRRPVNAMGHTARLPAPRTLPRGFSLHFRAAKVAPRNGSRSVRQRTQAGVVRHCHNRHIDATPVADSPDLSEQGLRYRPGAHPRLTAAHQPAVISTTATIAAPTPAICGARRRSPRTTMEHSTVETG